jgi:hypothetical protein
VSNDLFREPIRGVDCNLVEQFKIDPRYPLSSPCQFFSQIRNPVYSTEAREDGKFHIHLLPAIIIPPNPKGKNCSTQILDAIVGQ